MYEKTRGAPRVSLLRQRASCGHTGDDLISRYHAVGMYAVGTQTRPAEVGIQAEDLPGSWASHRVRGLVQRPPGRYHNLEFNLSTKHGRRGRERERGHGAWPPCSRSPVTSSPQTDVADHALDVLAESNVREIVVLGHRGPGQAAFHQPGAAWSWGR